MPALSIALLISAGCSNNVTAMFQKDLPPDGPRPSSPEIGINVLIKPEHLWPLNGSKALLIPMQMSDPREDRWGTALTNIAHAVLLQERVFSVIECYKNDTIPVTEIMQEARERGFDYIIISSVPDILVPSGNTAGWIGLNLRIQGTAPGHEYTIWSLYGGAELKPQPTQYDLLGRSPAVNAPSITTGFLSLVKAMAQIIKQG